MVNKSMKTKRTRYVVNKDSIFLTMLMSYSESSQKSYQQATSHRVAVIGGVATFKPLKRPCASTSFSTNINSYPAVSWCLGLFHKQGMPRNGKVDECAREVTGDTSYTLSHNL